METLNEKLDFLKKSNVKIILNDATKNQAYYLICNTSISDLKMVISGLKIQFKNYIKIEYEMQFYIPNANRVAFNLCAISKKYKLEEYDGVSALVKTHRMHEEEQNDLALLALQDFQHKIEREKLQDSIKA